MRLLIQLQCMNNFTYNLTYYPLLQGYFYSLLKNTEFEFLHNYDSFKLFCFSNIFPPENGKKDETKWLIFSSPRIKLVRLLMQKIGHEIQIGEMHFTVVRTKLLKIQLNTEGTIITATPIIIRIPNDKAPEYGINGKAQRYEQIYWRANYPVEAFIKQLEDNLEKKHKEFYKGTPPPTPYFTGLKLRKTVSIPLVLNQNSFTVIGSLWELDYQITKKKHKDLLEFALDAGLGELNSLGFGFVNMKED